MFYQYYLWAGPDSIIKKAFLTLYFLKIAYSDSHTPELDMAFRKKLTHYFVSRFEKDFL